jgi:hypothetical protein
MNSHAPAEKPAIERQTPSGNKTRRTIDTGGLVLFHIAIFGLIAWSDHKAATAMAFLGIPVLGMDLTYFFSPPKRRATLDPKPESGDPAQTASIRPFALELFVLLAPPVAFITWLLFRVWQRQTLSRNELLAIVIAMPLVVGLVSWIIKVRLTRYNIGIKNQITKFIAYSMLGTWIGATFFFVVFLVSFVMKLLGP